MSVLHIIIIVLMLSFVLLYQIYTITKRKFQNLIILDKRQQSYIRDLLNYNTRIAILQKLFFCIILSICNKTKSYGQKQLRNHFNIPEQIITNKQKLLQYFTTINNCGNISIKIQNGKYTIEKQ